MDLILYSAFILGLAGNLHCLGMCGPIALAIPIKRTGNARRFLSVMAYNTGRVCTYGAMGLLFGFLGKGFSILGLQQKLSIVAGMLMITMVFFPLLFKKLQGANTGAFQWVSGVKGALQRRFQNPSLSSLSLLGALNALLPCGLVYTAIAGAVVSGSALGGMAFMMVFGLGTLPVMFGLPYFKNLIQKRFLLKAKQVVPIAMFLMGSLFILRGADLGIPYVSPKAEAGQTLKCCHK